MSIAFSEEGALQHLLILHAARRKGLRVLEVSDKAGRQAHLLESGDRRELLAQGIPASWVTMQSRLFCDQKHLTKVLFDRLGIPSPRNLLFRRPDDPDVARFFQPDKRYVCKPQAGTNGVGVEMDITSPEQISAYWKRCKGLDDAFLLEEQAEGVDLRIQVVGGKIVAACIREPAFVIGDGTKTLDALIDARRDVIRQQNPANRLDLDAVSHRLIRDQGLALECVPAAGQKVRLKAVSNMGQGGVATDVTDVLHPRFHDWVDRIGAFLQSPYFAFDLIGSDPAADPTEACVALELNARAEWLHHTFSEGRTHDLAAVVVDQLFG